MPKMSPVSMKSALAMTYTKYHGSSHVPPRRDAVRSSRMARMGREANMKPLTMLRALTCAIFQMSSTVETRLMTDMTEGKTGIPASLEIGATNVYTRQHHAHSKTGAASARNT